MDKRTKNALLLISAVLLFSFLFFGRSGSGSAAQPAGNSAANTPAYSVVLPGNVSNASPAIDYSYYFNLGVQKLSANDLPGALDAFNKSASMNKSFAYAWFGLAYVKNIYRDKLGALADLNVSISINSSFAQGYALRCTIQNDLKQWNNSLSNCSRALALGLQEPVVFNNLGVALLKLKDYNSSLRYFDFALLSGGTDPQIFKNRALAKENIGNYTGAISDMEKYLEVNPGNEFDVKYLDFLKANAMSNAKANQTSQQKKPAASANSAKAQSFA